MDGRPEVPRLPLGQLQSAQLAADAEAAQAVHEPAPVALPGRPVVPLLPLSKLNPAAEAAGSRPPAVQAARIPAAHFSAMDASTHRSGRATGREEGERLGGMLGCQACWPGGNRAVPNGG